MAKSPRMVPGCEASGLVAPRMARPVLTASRPCQTIAQTGPLPMSGCGASVSVRSLRPRAVPGRACRVRGGVCGSRTGDEALEEGLVFQVRVVLLEVLLGRGDELDGRQLEAASVC